MDFYDLVKDRNSTRKYSEETVPTELIEKCLEAARIAPSACNSQPWFFHICNRESTRDRIAAAMNSGIYGKGINRFVPEAPVIIAVETKKRSRVAPWLAGIVRKVRYEMMDVAIALDHFSLQATELGLGTCWIGWFNESAVKKELGLPSTSHIDIMMTLGWKKGRAPGKKRKTIDEIRNYV